MLAQLQSLRQLSRAAKITCLFCASLVLLTLIAWGVFQLDAARVAWIDYMTLSRGVWLIVLLVATSMSVYFSLRAWLDEVPAAADDVEAAWQAGVAALAQVGVTLRDLPVYLFVGATSLPLQRRLVLAGKQKLLVDGPASSNAPLNWFATAEAIYLFCGSAGVLGRTVESLNKSGDSSLAELNMFANVGDLSHLDVSHARVESSAQAPHDDDSKMTMLAVEPGGQLDEVEQTGGTATLTQSRVAVKHTEQQMEGRLDELELLLEGEQRLETFAMPSGHGMHSASLSSLTSTEIANGQKILADVCTRLRGARRPVAAINGIGVVVDACLSTNSEAAARQCGTAIRDDLQQIQGALGQHAAVSMVLAGMERQAGVTEAIRRLGAVRSSGVTLGQIRDPREVQQPSTLEQAADGALTSIDKLAHYLIRDPAVLSIPGNSHLLRLVIDCRRRFASPLRVLLNQAFASGMIDAQQRPAFFNGVFLAATGERSVEQAFTEPIFQRMHGQQHWLAWTVTELRSQRRERLLARCLATLCATELLWLAWQLYQ